MTATGPWTADEDRFLREHYMTWSHAQMSECLGRTVNAVRGRRYTLSLPVEKNDWSASELESLRNAYRGLTYNSELDLDGLSAALGRHKTNICRKARVLGLTNQCRQGVKVRKSRRKYESEAELRAVVSLRTKQYIAENGHPRGMAGKKHSAQTRARIGEASRDFHAKLSDEERSAISLRALTTKVARYGSIAPSVSRGSWKAGWREIGGKRNYYRSRWEANYARYLHWLVQRGSIVDWAHEPETFWFEAIKRGVRSYLPDFRVWLNDESTELHEVKGWMDTRSKTTLRRMAKYHPTETIVIIREKQYNEISRKVGPLIDGWEASGRAGRY